MNSFVNVSGSDLLKMSREDFIQICGPADGIRLFNAIKGRWAVSLIKHFRFILKCVQTCTQHCLRQCSAGVYNHVSLSIYPSCRTGTNPTPKQRVMMVGDHHIHYDMYDMQLHLYLILLIVFVCSVPCPLPRGPNCPWAHWEDSQSI